MLKIIPIILVLFMLAGCKTRIEGEINELIIEPSTVTPDAVITPSPLPEIVPVALENEKDEYDDDQMGKIPRLPESAASIDLFIPDGWLLLDSVELDYNDDALIDRVGILTDQFEDNRWYPRILFVAWQTKDGTFVLDFEDINLVRGANEGGVYGDPYELMSAEGHSFTINAYGGSAWRWGESTTFEYKNEGWYLAQEQSTYGYGPVITSAYSNDYNTGIGIRQVNNANFNNLEVLALEERFELEYEVKLDPAPTLYEASQRWWLAPYRLSKMPVSEVTVSDSVALDKADVPIWHEKGSALEIRYMDESYILYTFRMKENVYLAVYSRESQIVNVISQADQGGDIGHVLSEHYCSPKIYCEKIYYSENVRTPIKLQGDDELKENEGVIYTQVLRMNIDGSGAEVVFRYDNDYNEGEVRESNLPYISTMSYPSGNELIISLYRGDASDSYYRMDLDGANRRLIGEL